MVSSPASSAVSALTPVDRSNISLETSYPWKRSSPGVTASTPASRRLESSPSTSTVTIPGTTVASETHVLIPASERARSVSNLLSRGGTPGS